MIYSSSRSLPLGTPGNPTGLVIDVQEVGDQLQRIGAIDDPAITDPDEDASSISSLKGIKQLLLDQLDLLAADGTYEVISGNGTSNAIVNGPLTLLAAVILTKGASSNTLNLYDALTATGDPIGPIDTTDGVGTILFGPRGLSLGTGLTAVLATGTGATVLLIYRPA